HVRQIVSRSRSTCRLFWLGGSGSRVFTCSRVSSTVSPWNGGRPASRAYRMAPSPYTSVAVVTAPRRAEVCSGALELGVPTSTPGWVRLASPSTRLARPKSVTRGEQLIHELHESSRREEAAGFTCSC